MKKNKMMRLASGLLVAVLLTTSTISGTFAKYTTQDSGSDEARVAKWGVALQVVGNLYGVSYKDAIVASAEDTGDTITVQASDWSDPASDVVAPGTGNEGGFAFSLNGTSEVDGEIITKISYENIYLTKGKYGVMVKIPEGVVTAQSYSQLGTIYYLDGDSYVAETAYNDSRTNSYYTLEDYVVLEADYYPVEYKMAGTKANYNVGTATADDFSQGVGVDTLAGVVSVLENSIGTETVDTDVVDAGKKTITRRKTFQTNADLADVLKISDSVLTWKWDFENNNTDCPAGDGACGFCKADTILGNLMAGDGLKGTVVKETDTAGTFAAPTAATGTEVKDYNLETGFSIDITVTQLD